MIPAKVSQFKRLMLYNFGKKLHHSHISKGENILQHFVLLRKKYHQWLADGF